MTKLLKYNFTRRYVKSVRIRSYSGPHFPAFRLNKERYGVSQRIHSKCGIMRTRITPNKDIFHAVPTLVFNESNVLLHWTEMFSFIIFMYPRGHLFSKYAKSFRKISISYLLIRTRTCAYQGVRNVKCLGNFVYLLN